MKKPIRLFIVGIIGIFIIAYINTDSESNIIPEKVQFVFKMNKAQAYIKEPCATYTCKKGDICYPDLGFECDDDLNGDRCYTKYNCN